MAVSHAVSLLTSRTLIDNAKFVKTDVEASNGIIHVIDTVILPE